MSSEPRFARIKGVLDSGLDRVDTLSRRIRRRPAEDLVPAQPGRSPLPPRRGRFHRDRALATYKRGVVLEDRLDHVLYPGDEALSIHFSAFFGEWGEQRKNRALYQGYFHRLRMFWPLTRYRFLFLTDTFGADGNGTYYKGESETSSSSGRCGRSWTGFRRKWGSTRSRSSCSARRWAPRRRTPLRARATGRRRGGRLTPHRPGPLGALSGTEPARGGDARRR